VNTPDTCAIAVARSATGATVTRSLPRPGDFAPIAIIVNVATPIASTTRATSAVPMRSRPSITRTGSAGTAGASRPIRYAAPASAAT
jgi:hypothetical protein